MDIKDSLKFYNGMNQTVCFYQFVTTETYMDGKLILKFTKEMQNQQRKLQVKNKDHRLDK